MQEKLIFLNHINALHQWEVGKLLRKTLREFASHAVVEQITQLIEQRCALTLKRLAVGGWLSLLRPCQRHRAKLGSCDGSIDFPIGKYFSVIAINQRNIS